MIFKDLQHNSTGVTNCPTCKDRPCQVSSSTRRLWSLLLIPPVLSRTEALARTPTPACTDAAAPEASRGATASTTPRCAATQVPGRPPGCSLHTPTSSRLRLSEPPEACGPDATCINRPSGLGYHCRCHLGKSGDKCTEGRQRGRGGSSGSGQIRSDDPEGKPDGWWLRPSDE